MTNAHGRATGEGTVWNIALQRVAQAYYLASPFPIERADTVPVPGLKTFPAAVSITQLHGARPAPAPCQSFTWLRCTGMRYGSAGVCIVLSATAQQHVRLRMCAHFSVVSRRADTSEQHCSAPHGHLCMIWRHMLWVAFVFPQHSSAHLSSNMRATAPQNCLIQLAVEGQPEWYQSRHSA